MDIKVLWWRATRWPRQQWRNVSKLVLWVPVIWEDVDWDYSSLYRVMLVKVRGMRVAHEGYNHTAEPERSVLIRQMRATEEALARLVADEYLSAEWDRTLDEVYPEGAWGEGMRPSEADSARVRELSAREDALRDADRAAVGTAMREWAHGWWD